MVGKNGNVVVVMVEEKTEEMWWWWTKNNRNVVGKQEKCGVDGVKTTDMWWCVWWVKTIDHSSGGERRVKSLNYRGEKRGCGK